MVTVVVMPTGQELYGGVATLPQDTSGSFDSVLHQLSAPSNLISDYIGPGTGPQLLTGYPYLPFISTGFSGMKDLLAVGKELYGPGAGSLLQDSATTSKLFDYVNQARAFPRQRGVSLAKIRMSDIKARLKQWQQMREMRKVGRRLQKTGWR